VSVFKFVSFRLLDFRPSKFQRLQADTVLEVLYTLFIDYTYLSTWVAGVSKSIFVFFSTDIIISRNNRQHGTKVSISRSISCYTLS